MTSDQALLSSVQFALIEPADGGQTWPSGLWSRDELLSYANTRQDLLLRNALPVVGISASLTVNAGSTRIALPTDWLRTVMVVWTGVDGTVRELVRSDSFEADHALPTWESTAASYPLFYTDAEAPNLFIQIGPKTSVAGSLVVFYVPVGATLTANGEFLVVPDELAHVVRYGILADALNKDGRGQDLVRAQYCRDRFDLGVDAARLMLEGWA